MRVFALDASGSAIQYLPKMLSDAKRTSTDPKDLVVTFSTSGIQNVQLLSDADADKFGGIDGGDGLEKLLEWMEARHLQPTDELIIYHDGYWAIPNAEYQMGQRRFTIKIKLFQPPYNNALHNLRTLGIDTEVVSF